jgi:hypothetical protein
MSESSANASVSGFHSDKRSTIDEFGRRPFAHRVADVLVQQPLGDCLVVSISGEWGAGKSTTMGYVKERLSEVPCKVLEFNPWRFPGEDRLLFELFDGLVKAINLDGHVLTDWQRLAAGSEHAIDPVATAGAFVSDTKMPGTGNLIKSVGNFFRTHLLANVEKVREQAIAHLEKEKMRIVVLMDDLDRLETDDLMALLRIIKLVADLPNTSFIMAMDEDHVARTIGKRIGGGVGNGRLYLEKIVQVRLPLPVIPWSRMRDYALSLVYHVLADSHTSLHPHEKARFEQVFDDLFSFEIKTPRSAKAWSNAVRFALGLLPEELNTADLMLLECCRLISPDLYGYIRSDMAKAMGEQMNVFRQMLGHKDTIAPLLQKLEKHFGHGTQQEIDDKRRAFTRWFPNLNEHQSEEDCDEWARNRRLCSRHYFWRYFSATISAEDLEDTVVSKLIERAISIQNPVQTGAEIEQELGKNSANVFLLKLRVMGGGNKDAIRPLVLALAEIGQKNNAPGSFPHTAIRLCVSLINELPDDSSQDALASECVSGATNLQWTWHLCHTLRGESSRHSNHELKSSFGLADLAGRILTELQRKVPEDHDLFGKFIWSVWHEGDRESLKTLLSVKLQESPKIAPFLLTSACNMRTSPTPKPPERCWIWNGEKGLIILEKIIDLQQLMTVLQTHYQNEMIAHEDENGPAMDHDLRTPEQLIPCFFASLQERRAKPDAPSGE